MLVTNTAYIALTKNAFSLPETVAIASLLSKGTSPKQLRQQVLEDDILQLRSRSSREGALQTVLKRLKAVPENYVHLLASDNPDTRRSTLLFLVLRENRLLRELVTEVLIEKRNRLDTTITAADLRTFFEAKREQEPTVAQWSTSTYERTIQNTVLTLVKAGLLYPIQPRGNYEVRSVPVPAQLKQQLILDGYEPYLTLMLN